MPLRQNGNRQGLIAAQAGIQRQKHAGGSFVWAIERLHVPIVITDSTLPDHPIIFSNNAFLRLVGYSLGEVLGRSCRDFMGLNVDPMVTSLLDEAFANSEEAEIRFYQKSGAPIWVSVFVSRILDDAGTAIQRTVSFLDISRRRAAEEELHRSNLLLERRVKDRTQALETALADKDLLLREINHRAKNTLQLAVSLLSLQARENSARSGDFDSVIDQLSTLTHVYELLDRTPSGDVVNAGECLRDLATGLMRSLIPKSSGIRLEIEAEDLYWPTDLVISVALIANEALTNALKHAFHGRQSGVVSLRLATKTPTKVELVIADDGVGRRDDLMKATSFGSHLIESLAKKIGATLDKKYDDGTKLILSIPTITN